MLHIFRQFGEMSCEKWWTELERERTQKNVVSK